MRNKNYLLKIFILFCICFGESLNTRGQTVNNVIPPSPNAASLGVYGDIPVGYYTGVPNISMPLYNIVSGNIEVPITLSYHASGIKVAQEASWVGLGWALNAGGCITRSVRGWDDFGSGSDEYHPRGYYFGPSLPEDSAYTMPLKELADGIGYYSLYALNEEDSEPDIFYYNFGKYSGKIMISKDEGPMVMNQDPLKIESFGSKMTITTPEGNSYYFGTVEETDKYNYILPSGARILPIDPNVINTWYLDSIVSPQNDKVIFKYKKSLDCVRNQLSATNNVLLDAGDDTPLIPWLIGHSRQANNS